MDEFNDLEEAKRNVIYMMYDESEDVQNIINQINEVLKLLEEYFNKKLKNYQGKKLDSKGINLLKQPIYSMLEIIKELNNSFDEYNKNDSNELKQVKRTVVQAIINATKSIDEIEIREEALQHYTDKEDFREEIEGIQQEYLKRYIKNAILYSILDAARVMNNFTDIWKKEEIVDQLFDVIDKNNIDFGDKKITKAYQKFLVLFYSNLSKAEIQQYIEYIPDFPEELEIALKTKTDKNYIINKKEKYSDKKIGIDPKINIGIEIETNSKLPHFFIENIISEIIKSQNDIREKWSAYVDASVGHNKGTEFVSPIFHDTPSELSEVGAVLETINELKYYTAKGEFYFNTAGQINIGIDYLDSKEAIVNFLEIYGNVEELLYHIATPNGELLRGFDDVPYATSKFAPISVNLTKMVVTDEMTRSDVIELATEILGFKKGSISLRDFNRFEFRMFNGTVSFEDWINNIRLCGKMIQISKELADIELNDERTPEEEYKLELKEKLKEDMPLEDKLEVFLDLMFEDEAEKKIYRQRFLDLQETLIKTTGKKEYDRGPREVYGQLFNKVELKRQDKQTNNRNDADWFDISDFETNYGENIEDAIKNDAVNKFIEELHRPMKEDDEKSNESSYGEDDLEW